MHPLVISLLLALPGWSVRIDTVHRSVVCTGQGRVVRLALPSGPVPDWRAVAATMVREILGGARGTSSGG